MARPDPTRPEKFQVRIGSSCKGNSIRWKWWNPIGLWSDRVKPDRVAIKKNPKPKAHTPHTQIINFPFTIHDYTHKHSQDLQLSSISLHKTHTQSQPSWANGVGPTATCQWRLPHKSQAHSLTHKKRLICCMSADLLLLIRPSAAAGLWQSICYQLPPICCQVPSICTLLLQAFKASTWVTRPEFLHFETLSFILWSFFLSFQLMVYMINIYQIRQLMVIYCVLLEMKSFTVKEKKISNIIRKLANFTEPTRIQPDPIRI